MLLRIFILAFGAFSFLIQDSGSCSITNLFVDEIETVDRAISTTEKRIVVLREIKNFMLELRHLEETVMKTQDSKVHAGQMVRLAEKILTIIREEHLESLFSSAYMEELRFYSSFARKASLNVKAAPVEKAK